MPYICWNTQNCHLNGEYDHILHDSGIAKFATIRYMKWGQHNIVLGRSSLNNIDRSQFLKVLEIHQTTVVFFVITVYRSRCLFIIIIIILKIISNVYFCENTGTWIIHDPCQVAQIFEAARQAGLVSVEFTTGGEEIVLQLKR